MPGQKLKVQNTLMKAAWDGIYYGVKYDKESGRALRSPRPIQPKSVYCNEIASEFGQARVHRRNQKYERLSWTFELRLSFGIEADISEFEDTISHDPILLTEPKGFVRLENTRIQHPPVKDPKTGTVAVLTVSVDVMPV